MSTCRLSVFRLSIFSLFFLMLLFSGCGSENDTGNSDGDTSDGDATDGDNPDGDTADGDSPDGDTPDGDAADGDTADGDTPDGDITDGDEEADQEPIPIPDFSELDSGWNAIYPGGDTICSRGTEYAYFIYKGQSDKLVIDFVGGGACWNAETCSIAGAIFSERVNVDRMLDAAENDDLEGILDHDNDQNLFKDWSHVVIPYCTGDVHWGDNVKTYGEGSSEVTINHKGAVNTTAVLDWVYSNFTDPAKIFVTGCSAGAYGSIGWVPHIMNHYQDADIHHMADCGAGVITENFFSDSFPSWNVDPMLPEFIEGLDPTKVDIQSMDLAYIYTETANYFPDRLFSQYNTAYDDNQTFFYQAMGGGTALEWSEKMYASIADIEENTENFVSYTAPGEVHCIIWDNDIYNVISNNVKLIDWMNDMVDGEAMQSIACVDCQQPEK